MPKMKSGSGAKKRFKVTGTGKLLRRHGMRSHNLEKKSSGLTRRLNQERTLSGPDAKNIKKMLGK